MRRHLQFTLRFILLATTVAAVVLGIFANRFKQRLRFIAAMKSLHAEVLYESVHEEIDDAWTQWLCRWLGEELVMPVYGVDLKGVNDEDLAGLSDAPELRELGIYDSWITTEGITRVSRLKRLELLALDSDRLAVRDLAPLAGLPRLGYLELPEHADGENTRWLMKLLPRCGIVYTEPDSGDGYYAVDPDSGGAYYPDVDEPCQETCDE